MPDASTDNKTVDAGQTEAAKADVIERTWEEAHLRRAKSRLLWGTVVCVCGVAIYTASLPLSFGIGRFFYLDTLLVAEFLSKLGLVMAGLGIAAPLLMNYLQHGSGIPLGLGQSTGNVAARAELRVSHSSSSSVSVSRTISDPAEALLVEITRRLNTEIGDLGRRGNTNLVIGILTTVVGIGILIYVVYSTFGDTEDFGWKSAVHTLMRITIALFIQTFAYFFLRLYKSSLDDVKYYQNEITNVESKWLAFRLASDLKNDALSKLVVEALLKTERNFVLKKGDSTLGLEREKLEKNEMLDLVKEAMGTAVKLRAGK